MVSDSREWLEVGVYIASQQKNNPFLENKQDNIKFITFYGEKLKEGKHMDELMDNKLQLVKLNMQFPVVPSMAKGSLMLSRLSILSFLVERGKRTPLQIYVLLFGKQGKSNNFLYLFLLNYLQLKIILTSKWQTLRWHILLLYKIYKTNLLN